MSEEPLGAEIWQNKQHETMDWILNTLFSNMKIFIYRWLITKEKKINQIFEANSNVMDTKGWIEFNWICSSSNISLHIVHIPSKDKLNYGIHLQLKALWVNTFIYEVQWNIWISWLIISVGLSKHIPHAKSRSLWPVDTDCSFLVFPNI